MTPVGLTPAGAKVIAMDVNTAMGNKSSHILVIHSYNAELSWTKQEKEGIDEGISKIPRDITVYHEFLDAKRYPSLHYQQQFLDYLRAKYQDTPLQVLMVTDDPGTNLIIKTRDEYFPDLPVVFLGVNQVQENLLNVPWLTGVFETHSVFETILEAKRQTGSDNLIVIGDSTETGQSRIDGLSPLKSIADAPQNIVVVSDIIADQVTETLGDYPSSWPIYLSGQLRKDNVDGPLVTFEKTAQQLSEQIKNPIYTDSAMHLGKGAVGGMVLEGHYHANQAVQLVEKLISGVPISEIEPVIESKNQWMFDAIELQRADINLKDLPPDSVLLNLTPSFYEQYRHLVWFLAISFALSIVTIVSLKRHSRTLATQVARKTQALNQKADTLDQQNQILEETLQKLRHTQAQLIHTEKMSSLGELVAGIAHEINNPITFIQGNVIHIQEYMDDMLRLLMLYQQEYPKPTIAIKEKQQDIDLSFLLEDVHKILDSVKVGSERIGKIVLSLRNFSRLDESKRKAVDLHSGIDSTLVILRNRLQKTETHPAVTVVKNYGDIPPITCEANELNQVFLSIIGNAIDAIREQPRDDELPEIRICTQVIENGKLRIAISNNGKAIPLEIQNRIFDPFFTTKPVGRGAGLGLSVSYSIIQKHGGTISVTSSSIRETTFEIILKQDR